MSASEENPSHDLRDPTNPDSDISESDATVLAHAAALTAEEFPAGLTPRELALALNGELLNHFHLQKFIGGGGMGVVFKALDTTLDRIVAVKVLATHAISEEDLQRRFLVEAQSTARLDHPNIARVHYVGRDRGLPYIVFEFIDGVNIRDLVLNQGPVSLADALSITYQIAHALAHAWQREVVHRDIKPSNILVTREGQAKLVDMGLARLYQSQTSDNDLTSTGMTLGTFDYISPEQARDARVADTRSDIYSLGCSLFFMLAGQPPFFSGTAVEKILHHQNKKPPLLRELNPDLPESIDQLLQFMLAKDPDDRPQTPAVVVSELAKILNALGLPLPYALAPLPTTKTTQTDAWKNHIPWALPLACLVGACLWMGTTTDVTEPNSNFLPIRIPDQITENPAESTPKDPLEESDPGLTTAPVSSFDQEVEKLTDENQGLDIDLSNLLNSESADSDTETEFIFPEADSFPEQDISKADN